MIHEKRRRAETRILFPPDSWMPVQNDVFTQVFPALEKHRAPHLYMAMYERARRSQTGKFAANLQDLSELIDCDPRTARNCVIELCQKGFVKMVYQGGAARSRTDKPKFRVPLAELDLAPGGWAPIPRFLVNRYLPAFPGSLLLIVLLHIQHFRWQTHSWVGVTGLRKITKWRPRTIYRALNLMGHRKRWEQLRTGLPWPLRITYSPDGKTRHFSVRAVRYYLPPGRKKRVVGLSEEFAIYFGYRKVPGRDNEETED